MPISKIIRLPKGRLQTHNQIFLKIPGGLNRLFFTGSQSISIHEHGDHYSYFKPNYDFLMSCLRARAWTSRQPRSRTLWHAAQPCPEPGFEPATVPITSSTRWATAVQFELIQETYLADIYFWRLFHKFERTTYNLCVGVRKKPSGLNCQLESSFLSAWLIDTECEWIEQCDQEWSWS